MAKQPHALEHIQIASPCQVSWDTMTGDEQVRFCGQCHLNVYNLSELTRPEAEALIQNTEGRLCVRYFQREDGTVITRDCPEGVKQVRQKRIRLAGVAALLAGLLAGVPVFKPLQIKLLALADPPPTVMMGAPPVQPMMGDVAMPVQPPNPTPQPVHPIMGKIKMPDPKETPPDPKPCPKKDQPDNSD